MENRMSIGRITSGSGGVLDWRQLLLNWSVPCPSCHQVGILRTDQEFRYLCRHCGDDFDIREGISKASGGTAG
jgi:hypothetical protein